MRISAKPLLGLYERRLSGMNKSRYTPKVGDLVQSQDHNGVYKVLKVSESGMADLQMFIIVRQQLIGTVMQVPRTHLKPFKEDASQAAARIVREATERE
jgi:hypothetical protein